MDRTDGNVDRESRCAILQAQERSGIPNDECEYFSMRFEGDKLFDVGIHHVRGKRLFPHFYGQERWVITCLGHEMRIRSEL